jgi:hypothetical protein
LITLSYLGLLDSVVAQFDNVLISPSTLRGCLETPPQGLENRPKRRIWG